MSRAFIKEDGGGEDEGLPERRPGPEPNYVTPRGLRQLRERVAGLSARVEALPAEARRRSSEARDLRYYESRLDSAILIPTPAKPPEQVQIGVLVSTRGADGSAAEFSIVGEDEAEAGALRISWCSPLARALMGARVGEKVLWRRPAGDLELEILAIRLPSAEI